MLLINSLMVIWK